MIKIQLLGRNAGYLDVLEDSIFALNISVADIKDVTKRTGSFSKTILLPGNKNNNRLLNDYFDVNVTDGTFSINKVQRCLILDNNVPIFDNMVLQLKRVIKNQATNMEDDIVQYEVSIKDVTADFFTDINNKYLTDLDFTEFNHTYTAQQVADSFSHSYIDGYKYVVAYGDDNYYSVTEMRPAIYAKQYWTKIHTEAGFSYTWADEFNENIRFDKLLIPFSSGDIKLTEEAINASRVIATGGGQTDIYSSLSTPVGGFYSWQGISQPLKLNFEVQDPINAFDPSTGLYTSQFYITQPNYYEIIVEFDYQIKITNLQNATMSILNSSFPNWGTFNVIASVYNTRTTAEDSVFVNAIPTPTILGQLFPPLSTTTIFTGKAKAIISSSNHQLGDDLEIYVGIRHGYNGALQFSRITEVEVHITKPKVTYQLSSTQIYNTPVVLNQYIPDQIKQSDFIKSIMTMYNLFVELDESDPSKLIYTTRDAYYDAGSLVDWTDKLAREDEQELEFLPELNAKSFIFSYKQDADLANKTYLEVTNEVYGQHQVIFSNNYVKGVEKKEIIFSPTPSQRTNWNSILPLLPNAEQKYNIRILLDNGNKPCQNWFIVDYIDPNITLFPPSVSLGQWVELSYYPHISHLSDEVDPTFDLNFGVCDFYFYDIRNITNNNLFNNFWRRTCAQINSGRLFTGYFHLKSSDISNLKLNSKIRIDNSYWNINKIIDFDANKQELTKVELMSIDLELDLPTFGKKSLFLQPGQQLAPPYSPVFLTSNDIIVKSIKEDFNYKNKQSKSTNNSNNGVINLGNYNSIDGGVQGLIIGDFVRATQSGVYIGNNTFIGENLGNVGGLPGTLLVDNTTAGTDIILDGGSVISSGPLDILELNSINSVRIAVDEPSDVYQIRMNNPELGISTFDTGASVYNNNVLLSNDASNGIRIETVDQTTSNNSVIQTTKDFCVMKHLDASGDVSDSDVGYAAGTPYVKSQISNATNGDNNFIEIDNTGIKLNADTFANVNFGRTTITNTSITLEIEDSVTSVQNNIIVNQNFIRSNASDGVDTSEIQIYPAEIFISTLRLNITTLQAFADDGAAVAAGLVQGDIYQTDGTGALTEKGILMVVQ